MKWIMMGSEKSKQGWPSDLTELKSFYRPWHESIESDWHTQQNGCTSSLSLVLYHYHMYHFGEELQWKAESRVSVKIMKPHQAVPIYLFGIAIQCCTSVWKCIFLKMNLYLLGCVCTHTWYSLSPACQPIQPGCTHTLNQDSFKYN